MLLVSGKAEHGKDEFAKIAKKYLELSNQRVLIAHYGDLVKYTCATFFGWDGQKNEAGRTLLQEVGTDKIREQYPDFWVDYIGKLLRVFHDQWDFAIIPDTRFPNEIECLNKYGLNIETVRISRYGHKSKLTDEQLNHPSETSLDNYPFDCVIDNSGSYDDFVKSVEQYIDGKIRD